MSDPDPIHIVRLEGIYGLTPHFTIPHTYSEYLITPHDPATIISRLASADVVITTRVPITDEILSACPSIKLIAVSAIGCDHIDLPACRAHGVTVCNVPAASNESVAEHAIALYFALRRKVVPMHALTRDGTSWVQKGSLGKDFGEVPGTCREEVLAVVGVGELGTRVATIAKALGMRVLLTERKGVPVPSVREGRTHFEEALGIATVVVITLPLEPSTVDLIAAREFALMRPDCLLINVARGGIVHEPSLITALRTSQIGGAASDVFTTEPAGLDNPLVEAANEEWAKDKLVLSPHLAWYARASLERLRVVVEGNVQEWSRGKGENLVV